MISTAPTHVLTPGQRAELLDLVERHFGIRASDYGAARLEDAIRRVLPLTAYASAADLLASVRDGVQPRWAHDLVDYLTVGETYFLRDPAQVAALRETILPDILMRRQVEQRIRVWSAGCSTGEEPYTLAMLLLEKQLSAAWDVLLVGTDVNRESLRVAHEGQYPEWSFRATPEHLRARYFERVEKGWRLNASPRHMVRFGWMNLAAAQIIPPSVDLDLIVCRNVTIYFDEAATQRLYQALIGALTPGGWLILGPSDPLPADRTGLERVEAHDTVLWRRVWPQARARAVRSAPAPASSTRLAGTREPSRTVTAEGELKAGLRALEVEAPEVALDHLRRATFRDPHSAIAQFGLARAYLATGDPARAHAALLHTRRLLAPLAADAYVPGADALPVGTLRETVQSYLASPSA